MILSIEYRDEFTPEETRLLWDLGVDMDDWDYALICPPEILREEEYQAEVTEWEWFNHVQESDRTWPRESMGDGSYRISAPFDKGHYVTKEETRKRWVCDDWQLDNLLRGVCTNTWYLVEWKGEKRAIGVAYHA